MVKTWLRRGEGREGTAAPVFRALTPDSSLPQFLLPEPQLLDRPLPQLVLYSLLSLPHLPSVQLMRDFVKRSPCRGSPQVTSNLRA